MSIIFFQTSSFFISALISPEEVVGYNIAQKYFAIGSMIFYMFAEPLWSAYGDAYNKKEYQWIKSTFNRLRKVFLLVVLGLLFMIIIQKPVFKLWLNGKVEVDYVMSLLFVIFYSCSYYNKIYIHHENTKILFTACFLFIVLGQSFLSREFLF